VGARRRTADGEVRQRQACLMRRTIPHTIHGNEAPMASIDWKRNADAAFEEARRTGRMVLLDFSAAPM
jgi:hypothetical protein